jgi:hypothetical protein
VGRVGGGDSRISESKKIKQHCRKHALFVTAESNALLQKRMVIRLPEENTSFCVRIPRAGNTPGEEANAHCTLK